MCVDIGSISDVVTALVTVLGVCISIYTWKKNTKLEKNKALVDFFRETHEVSDIAEVFRKIDYGERWYGKDFHNSEFEGKVDKALIRYAYFIDLLNDGYVETSKDDCIKYEIHRVLNNFDTQAYLFNLRNFTNKQNTSFPYKALVDFGKSCGILDETFFNAELGEKKYGKFLNW